MDKRIDLENIGKRMPYRIPEGYADRLQQKIMANARAETARRRVRMRRISWSAAASIAVAIIVGAAVFHRPATTESERLMQSASLVYAQMPADEQELIDESFDDDIFLTLTDN